ncbi:MAG: hypothetical protein ACKOCX_08545 [Planctomycetota bacterium]
MDYTLHRPQSGCSRTGRPFAAGEEFFSALVRGQGGLERLDVSADAWDGPPEGTIAWWKSRHLPPGEAGPVLAPVDVLLDALEALEDQPDDAPLRYLLALQLVRRRVLRIEPTPGDGPDDAGVVVFSCRRRDRDYRVRETSPAVAADPAVAERLTALLWSGDAA